MKRKVLVLSVVFSLFAVLALSTSAFAWTATGPVTKISKWASGAIYIDVDTGSGTVSKALYGGLTDDHQKQLLAMALTAQSAGSNITLYITSGTIRSISIP
jgi:hypothetical protein